MMNNYMFANSECSSGCESGWTLYLENSFVEGNGFLEGKRIISSSFCKQEEEEEDLSMVSDASSGPPHLHEDECCFSSCPSNNNDCFEEAAALPKKTSSGKRDKERETRRRKIHHQKQPSLLDDTASSPLFDFSIDNNYVGISNQASGMNVLDSQGYSTTLFQQEESAYQQHYGFFHPSLSLAGNLLQHNQLSFQESISMSGTSTSF